MVTRPERAAFFELERFQSGRRASRDKRHEMFVKSLRAEDLRGRHRAARLRRDRWEPARLERVGIVAPSSGGSSLDQPPRRRRQGLAAAATTGSFVAGGRVRGEPGQGKGNGFPFAKGGEFNRFYASFDRRRRLARQPLRSFSELRERRVPERAALLKTRDDVAAYAAWFQPPRHAGGAASSAQRPRSFPSIRNKTFFILGIANSAPVTVPLRGLIVRLVGGRCRRSACQPQANAKQSGASPASPRRFTTRSETGTAGTDLDVVRAAVGHARPVDANLVDALDGVARTEASAEKQIQSTYSDLNTEAYKALRHPRQVTRAQIEKSLGEARPTRGHLAADGGQDHRTEAHGARLALARSR